MHDIHNICDTNTDISYSNGFETNTNNISITNRLEMHLYKY